MVEPEDTMYKDFQTLVLAQEERIKLQNAYIEGLEMQATLQDRLIAGLTKEKETLQKMVDAAEKMLEFYEGRERDVHTSE